MIPERILNIITGFIIVLMMGVICFQLARQFDPEYNRPNLYYTNHGFRKLEAEVYKYKNAYRDNDRLLKEIAGE